MSHVGERRSCFLGTPDQQRLASMHEECVSKWMVRMAEPESCVSHFSGVASPACSAAGLRAACEETSRHFTKRDAQQLCKNLQAAHQDFWPGFWRGDRSGAEHRCPHRGGDDDSSLATLQTLSLSSLD